MPELIGDGVSRLVLLQHRQLDDLACRVQGKARRARLEVGSYEGRSAVWLIKNVLADETSSIDCCDPPHRSASGRTRVQFVRARPIWLTWCEGE